jgi:AcrR family transcriptional regulator
MVLPAAGESGVALPAAGEGRLGVAGGSLPRSGVVEIQRARLLSAAVSVLDERGYAGATVAHITRRARVSRRTFYELFEDREACLLALLQRTVEEVRGELRAAYLERLRWRERVRVGLGAILAFLDREPVLARVCVVQSARGGAAVLEYRERLLGELAAVLDEGRRSGSRGEQCSPLNAEGLVGAALTILYARLLRREREPLAALQGELVAMIVLPYCGAAAARREQQRPASAAGSDAQAERGDAPFDPLQGLEMRMTYRTARVLEGVAEHPGASNRLVSDYAEIQDQGQVSKLLARLERLGLVLNAGAGAHQKGECNAWTLTDRGELVVQSIAVHTSNPSGAV